MQSPAFRARTTRTYLFRLTFASKKSFSLGSIAFTTAGGVGGSLLVPPALALLGLLRKAVERASERVSEPVTRPPVVASVRWV